ncbi:MAG: hypothetical protein D6759_08410 [Chloroflexi bacterium]|nr:MAG: hypothetical protein D6759_08410 [Chloroflexota bacterium]
MKGDKLFWALVVVGFLVGLVGLVQRMTGGHTVVAYNTYIPWGLWVAAYIYFIGLSAGAFLLSTLVYVFRFERLERIGKLALWTALVTLVAALFSIWMDLGHVWRFWRLFLHTNFRSVMGWMIWLYTAYFILLVVELWFAMRADFVACKDEPGLKGALCRFLAFGKMDVSEAAVARDQKVLRVLGSIGVPLAVAFHGSVGAIFGVVGARPYWHSGLTPIAFLVGALLSGGALLTFITAIWGPDRGTPAHRDLVLYLGRITLLLLALDALIEWAEYSIALWHAVPAEAESVRLVLFGSYWWVFWIVHLGLGVVAPAILLVAGRRSLTATAVGAGLIAVTFLSVRLNVVIPGLAVEELEGLRLAFNGPGLTFDYFPTLPEWLFFVWTASLAGLLFLVGHRFLPLTVSEPRV